MTTSPGVGGAPQEPCLDVLKAGGNGTGPQWLIDAAWEGAGALDIDPERYDAAEVVLRAALPIIRAGIAAELAARIRAEVTNRVGGTGGTYWSGVRDGYASAAELIEGDL